MSKPCYTKDDFERFIRKIYVLLNEAEKQQKEAKDDCFKSYYEGKQAAYMRCIYEFDFMKKSKGETENDSK